MKIAAYNVNSIRIRLDTIIAWLDKHKPDVLCIQETKCQDEVFPLLVLQSTGYQVHYRGMKSYNGVAVLTREKSEAVFYGFDDNLPEIDDARLMRVVVQGIPIINTYVPNGYKVGTPQHEYKLKWYGRLRSYFAQHLSADRPARVINQVVAIAVVLEHLRDQSIAGCHIGDIAGIDPCLAACGLDLLLGIDELFLAAGDEHDLGARSGELERGCLADP